MDNKYQYVHNRFKKLFRTLETLCEENAQLRRANAKLRAENAALHTLADARERVFKSLQNGPPQE
jgi:regulator of replication initiation timing